MQILVLGEGATDLGRIRDDLTLELEGAVPILVRRIFESVLESVEFDLRAEKWRGVRLSARRRKLGPTERGYAAKLKALLGLSEGRNADAIVAVRDRDGKKNKDRIDELNEAREQLRQDGKPCAVGLAIEELEAWLLADEKALSHVSETTIERQPDPETLTSRDDTSDNNPKGRLSRRMETALGRSIGQDEFPELYAEIAQQAQLEVLRKRCPEGFARFADQVEELARDG